MKSAPRASAVITKGNHIRSWPTGAGLIYPSHATTQSACNPTSGCPLIQGPRREDFPDALQFSGDRGMVTTQEAHRIDATKEARARVTYILKRLVTILNPDFQFDSDVSTFQRPSASLFIGAHARPVRQAAGRGTQYSHHRTLNRSATEDGGTSHRRSARSPVPVPTDCSISRASRRSSLSGDSVRSCPASSGDRRRPAYG